MEQERSQIGARGITNRGNFKDFQSGQRDYKSRQGFLIGQTDFTRGTEHKSGQKGFQIGGGITNRCRTNVFKMTNMRRFAEFSAIFTI